MPKKKKEDIDLSGIDSTEKENLKKILLATREEDDVKSENILRPMCFEDFLGQEKAKENLSIFISAAKSRKEALDHIFLVSPPGLGKTTLAGVVAHEMNVPIKYTSAPVLEKPKDLAGILANLEDKSIFFVDEIHRLKPQLEEMLYIAMEDFKIDWVLGAGTTARTVRLPLPHFTLIGATTKAGKVSSPLYTRFGITVRMEYYPHNEIELIIKRSARILGVSFTEDAVKKLSFCARGTPRIANRLIRRIRDFADVRGVNVIDVNLIEEAMKRLEIDKNGLEAQDIRILKNIIEIYGGGPVGAETLAISVGESVQTLEDFYEPYLIQCGFLNRTPRGRVVTDRAYELLNIKKDFYENQGTLF